MYVGGGLLEKTVESCSSFLSVFEDEDSASCGYRIAIVSKLVFVSQIINRTASMFESFEWFESSGEKSKSSESGVGCGCVHGYMTTPLQASFTEYVTAGVHTGVRTSFTACSTANRAPEKNHSRGHDTNGGSLDIVLVVDREEASGRCKRSEANKREAWR